MNAFLYYLDKLTAWLDFSWLIKKKVDDAPPTYRVIDPLFFT
jgi:hypothetical protein